MLAFVTEYFAFLQLQEPAHLRDGERPGLAGEHVAEAVNDTMRQQYLHDHIDAVGQALQAGCDVRGYFVWSFQVQSRLPSLHIRMTRDGDDHSRGQYCLCSRVSVRSLTRNS
jgi:hypothetical protein